MRVLLHQHFWCTPGFDWCQSLVHLDASELGCAPTEPYLKRVVWSTVQINSDTVRCWCERNLTKSHKWTAINDVLFDKNVCLCVSLNFLMRVTAIRKLYVSLLFAFRTFAVHSALETKPMVQKHNNIKMKRPTMHFAAFSSAVVFEQRGKPLLAWWCKRTAVRTQIK